MWLSRLQPALLSAADLRLYQRITERFEQTVSNYTALQVM